MAVDDCRWSWLTVWRLAVPALVQRRRACEAARRFPCPVPGVCRSRNCCMREMLLMLCVCPVRHVKTRAERVEAEAWQLAGWLDRLKSLLNGVGVARSLAGVFFSVAKRCAPRGVAPQRSRGCSAAHLHTLPLKAAWHRRPARTPSPAVLDAWSFERPG